MGRFSLRLFFVHAAIAAAVLLVALPALAAPDIESVSDDIKEVVRAAKTEMQDILNTFVIDLVKSTDVDELDVARSRAERDINREHARALDDLNDLLSIHPDELAAQVADAKASVASARANALAEITDLYNAAAESFPTTTVPPATTTTAPSSTTTTRAKPPSTTPTTSATTTTVNRTTTTRPGETTTTLPETTTTTAAATSATTPTLAGVPPSDPGSGPPDASGGTATDQMIAAPPVFDVALMIDEDLNTAIDAEPEHGMMMTSLMAGVSIVLPPAIVPFTVAPFIVLEVLFKTVFESVQAFIIPFLILLVAAGAFVWRETRRSPQDVRA